MLFINNKYILIKERPADLIESGGLRDTTHNIIIREIMIWESNFKR